MTRDREVVLDTIRGMRNRVVREYKEVDLKILWEVVRSNIPELLQILQNSTFSYAHK